MGSDEPTASGYKYATHCATLYGTAKRIIYAILRLASYSYYSSFPSLSREKVTDIAWTIA